MADLWLDYDINASEATNSYSPTQPRTPNPNLDKDAFLQLLVTQMQYQDPLNPMDNSQMLSQMAQFSALEQMNNVSNTTVQSMAFSMIGKAVEGTIETSTGEKESVVGVVSSVLVQGGKTYLKVGEQLLQADKVTNVYTDTVNSINQNVGNNQSFAMIGKVVQAITLNGELKPSGFVEGKVDSVKFDGSGGTILVVGDKEVFPGEIVSVGSENMLIGKMIDVEVSDGGGEGAPVFEKRAVSDVIISGEKAYLRVGGENVYIEKINYATDALTLVGNGITYAGITGTVDGVVIREGVPHLRVGSHEISYKLFKGIAEEGETD